MCTLQGPSPLCGGLAHLVACLLLFLSCGRTGLMQDLESEYARYQALNSSRNPFQNIEYYLIPMVVALMAFILRWVAETSCSRHHRSLCTNMSDAMGHIYVGIITFIVIMSANRIRQFVEYMRQIIPILIGGDLQRHLKTA
jgi:hypothetical protein